MKISNSHAVLDAIKSVISTDVQLMRIGLHEPEFEAEDKKAVLDAIESTFVSSVGAYVDRFEEMVAEKFEVKKAVAVMNGTAALHICLLMAGVSHDDEVLIPALTFVATANAVRYCGAVPHFVDSEMQSFGICATKLDAYLESIADRTEACTVNKKTKRRIAAIVPMHVFGHPNDMDAINKVANKWNIPVVEDAAESLGSRYKDRAVGGEGVLAATSFNGNKIITTGGGGAILTNDPETAKHVKHLTTTAKLPHKWEFDHDRLGYNYRMPNLNAALGCAQLGRLEQYLEEKRALARAYQKRLANVTDVFFVEEPKYGRSNYWLNSIFVKDKSMRDELLEISNNDGIMLRPCWKLMCDLPMYGQCQTDNLENAQEIVSTLINMPSSPFLGRPFINSGKLI